MKTTSLAAAVALILLAACSREPAPKADASAAAPAVATAQADIHPFQIGQLRAWALRDGTITLSAGDAKQSPWTNTAEVTAFLAANGVADGRIVLPIQPLLIRDGDRVVLIDAGAGGQMGTEGKLRASLIAAGVQPDQVTDILISHAHGDHLGGLTNSSGQLTFPNATIRMSAAEWEFAKAAAGEAGQTAVIVAITPKVERFEPGAQVTPSIRAVPLAGHTPGHSGYEIVSGQDRLLYFGDALHSSLISVQRPEWTNGWDSDSAAAIATRQGLLERGARETLRYYGVHFPYPGLGRVQRRDDGFVWVPETPPAG